MYLETIKISASVDKEFTTGCNYWVQNISAARPNNDDQVKVLPSELLELALQALSLDDMELYEPGQVPSVTDEACAQAKERTLGQSVPFTFPQARDPPTDAVIETSWNLDAGKPNQPSRHRRRRFAPKCEKCNGETGPDAETLYLLKGRDRSGSKKHKQSKVPVKKRILEQRPIQVCTVEHKLTTKELAGRARVKRLLRDEDKFHEARLVAVNRDTRSQRRQMPVTRPAPPNLVSPDPEETTWEIEV